MKKLFLLVTTVLLALTSCTEENAEHGSVVTGKIQASFEESIASRLAIGEGNILKWSAGDAFKMCNDAGEGSVWTLEGSGGDVNGVFGGIVPEGTLKGAAFPSTASPSLSGNTLSMTLPSEITYEAGVCNLPMWSSFSSLEDHISFKHLGALLKVDFADLPEGYNSLVVTTDKAISGTFTADLSASEPVLEATENGVNSVEVSFAAINGSDNDRLFFIPLPVGTYGSINVSISDGTNTLSIADWTNRAIVRKKVYVASLSYRVSDAKTPTEITEELDDMMGVTSNASVDITNEVDASKGSIVIPAEASKIALNFEQVPSTSSSAPLKFEEAAASDGSQLVVSLPASAEETYMEFDTPTTTVNVEGGNYKKIVARTASNTLVLGENSTVEELVILAGNVVLDGGEVTALITRDESNLDEITYVYVNDESELDGVTIGKGIEVVHAPQNIAYVTFSANAEQTLTMSASVETLEYSVNGGTWAELGTSTVTFGGEYGDLRLRGKNAQGTGVDVSISFGSETVPVACKGDIRTLVDYENYDSGELDTSNARFGSLFRNCRVLTSAPDLPATVLADKCYYKMFQLCTNLVEAPALPATTLADNCYRDMFSACYSLTEAPELPAKIMAEYCYYNMFASCENLKSAPLLPATTLADYCYRGMFSGCKSLTSAPALPATTLANNCYYNMLGLCDNLIEAPVLPATTLANDCYSYMFMGCVNLTEAPALPATTLAGYCYYGMFYGCHSLLETPVLPALTLTTGCYSRMFMNCKSLVKVSMLATDISAVECLLNWLTNVPTAGTFYKNNNVTDISAYGIPEGWNVKDYGMDVVRPDFAETADGNYEINSVAGLKQFAASVEAGNTYAGKIIKLNDDVDLQNELWTPIGAVRATADFSDVVFAGTLDGQNHAIKNLKIHSSNYYFVGLFASVHGATLKNLTIMNGEVKNQYLAKAGYAGAFVGYSEGLTIVNCHNVNCAVTVERSDNQKKGAAAGLVGYGYEYGEIMPTYIACTNSGTVSSPSNPSGIVYGGFGVGANIVACVNTGDVVMTNVTGGGYPAGIVCNFGGSPAQYMYGCFTACYITEVATSGALVADAGFNGSNIHYSYSTNATVPLVGQFWTSVNSTTSVVSSYSECVDNLNAGIELYNQTATVPCNYRFVAGSTPKLKAVK